MAIPIRSYSFRLLCSVGCVRFIKFITLFHCSKVKMVTVMLEGIHFINAVEALSLGAKIGIHPWIIYDIISNAAGNSWYVFSQHETAKLYSKNANTYVLLWMLWATFIYFLFEKEKFYKAGRLPIKYFQNEAYCYHNFSLLSINPNVLFVLRWIPTIKTCYLLFNVNINVFLFKWCPLPLYNWKVEIISSIL